jgi:polyisoprenoid-binding protein YceI
MRSRRWLRWVLIGIGAVVVLVVAVPFVYINFIRADAPPRLSLDQVASETTTTGASTDGTTGGADPIDGTYRVTGESTVGYRANEVLFGQAAEAAGRTSDVSGSFEIQGTTISSADFTAQMATVKSDQDRRDSQFKGRIMDVATYPTSTFSLSSPIHLSAIPALDQEIKVSATGKFTLRGVTKSVTFDVTASRKGADTVAVQGVIPITWSDWNIPEPSFGPAQVSGSGDVEFLLVLKR